MGTTTPLYKTVNNCEIEVPKPCCLVIFGASGDLARRKLLPSLYRLYTSGMLPEKFFILGTGRSDMGTERFREIMLLAIKEAMTGTFDQKAWEAFSSMLYYSVFDYSDPA